jgi:hypothetical protein
MPNNEYNGYIFISEGRHEKFIRWANKMGINLNHRDDWEMWKECFDQGYKAAVMDCLQVSQQEGRIPVVLPVFPDDPPCQEGD